MLTTSIYNKHKALKAKMHQFAGYLMPMNYSKGIQIEYNAVRKNAGVFDVSHMGQIFIEGSEAILFIQKIAVNDITKLNDGDAQYSAICNNDGGIIDDVIVYRISNDNFIFIVNASNINDVYAWFNLNNKYDCIISNKSSQFSLIAIQGPKSRKIIEDILNCILDMRFYQHKKYKFKSKDIFISRTGYTGELGFELLANHRIINEIWDLLMIGKVEPCGLVVRDILRIEMKYCLYGNDINQSISPIQAGLNWIVKNKTNFIGSEIINKQKKKGIDKKLVCIKMIDKCIPRAGYKVLYDNFEIGKITSGTFSSSLNAGIAMAYINVKYLDCNNIYIDVRGKKNKGILISPPFIKNTSLFN